MQPVNSAAWLELPVNNPSLFYLVLVVEIKSTSGFSRLCCSWEVVNPNDTVIFHSGTFYRNSLRLFFTTKSEVLPSLCEFVQNKPHSSWFSGTFCFCYTFALALPEQQLLHSSTSTALPGQAPSGSKTNSWQDAWRAKPRRCTNFIKSHNGLGWKGPWRLSCSNPLPWTGRAPWIYQNLSVVYMWWFRGSYWHLQTTEHWE